MSFRKRGEIVGGPQTRIPTRLGAPARHPVTSTAPKPAAPKNPSVRPSTITSQPVVSTGNIDLDKILLHLGLPLGTFLVVEESGTTDFASVVMRAFAAQGVVHSRLEKEKSFGHVVAVGVPPQWSAQLPGIYKGSSRDKKRAVVAANESKISVSNLAEGAAARSNDLRIAWRYGLGKEKPRETELENGIYANQFDSTESLSPRPGSSEVTTIPISEVNTMIKQITSVIDHQIKKSPSVVVRLVIPGLLHPAMYPPELATAGTIIPFIHSLRCLVRKFPLNLVILSSISLDLFPRDTNMVFQLEQLADAAVHLQPFNQEMTALIERAYKNEPGKVQHGLVNVVKIPVLSEKGMMLVHDGEYAFRNGRKKFEIEPWGIPVEEEEELQTKENVDF